MPCLTQHLLHLGVRQALDLRQLLHSARGRGRMGEHEAATCRGGLFCRCPRGHKLSHLAGVHQQRLAGVVSCSAGDQGRCIGVAPSSRRRQQRRWVLQGSSPQVQGNAPASLAFLMSPRLMPSASSFSTGCRQHAVVRVAVVGSGQQRRSNSGGSRSSSGGGSGGDRDSQLRQSRRRCCYFPSSQCTQRAGL